MDMNPELGMQAPADAATLPPGSAEPAAGLGERRVLPPNGWRAFAGGLGRSLRYPHLLALAYLVSLLSAGILALLPALMLSGPAHRLAIREAANGIDDWLVVEVMLAPVAFGVASGSAQAVAPDWLGQWYLAGGLLCLALPLAAWLPTSFLSGGIVLTYAEAPRPFGWRRFLWGCWHWFGAFLLLNAIQGAAAQIIFGVLLGGVVAGWVVVGSWLNWITVPLTVLLAAWWLALFESTRAVAVLSGRRNIFSAFGQAFMLTFRRPLALGLLYGLMLAVLLAVHALFRLGLMPIVPLNWWPLVFLLTQAFILLRVWLRLARWAGVVTAVA